MGILMGIITNFLFIWLQQLGARADVMRWSLIVTCVSGVFLFHFSAALAFFSSTRATRTQDSLGRPKKHGLFKGCFLDVRRGRG